MIDLHCHSTASDGEFEPGDLPGMARAAGVHALALTDHDTTDGVSAFMEAAVKEGIEGIPGVELSCSMPTGEKIHIVGLFIDFRDSCMQQTLSQLRIWRQERNRAMLSKLAELGKPVEWERVLALAGATGEGDSDVVGRPHIAQAMVEKGYCHSVQVAFQHYLGSNCPAYVPRRSLEAVDGIRMIHQSGGLAIWAHSATSVKGRTRLARVLTELVAMKLDGMEVVYPLFTPADQANTRELAIRHGLLFSGGTDFHGPHTTPGISIGTGYGKGFFVPDEFLDGLKRLRSEGSRK